MAPGVTDRDLGWQRIEQELRGADGAHVLVGLHADAEPYEAGQGDDSNVAQVASHLEFGTSRMPPRPFLRPTIDGGREKYATLIDRVLGLILRGKLTTRQGLSLVGIQASQDVKGCIRHYPNDPPLAESTVAAKVRKAQGTFKSYGRKAGLRGDDLDKFVADKSEAYTADPAPLRDTGHMLTSVTYAVVYNGEVVEHPTKLAEKKGEG